MGNQLETVKILFSLARERAGISTQGLCRMAKTGIRVEGEAGAKER